MPLRGPGVISHRLPDEPVRNIIQGREAGNPGEARVATALDKLRHRYLYQYRILDIKGVRGAYVIDFLILTTPPRSTPLEVFGQYWHSGRIGAEDEFRMRQIEQHFLGKANKVVIVWGNEIQNQTDTDNIIRQKVGAP